MKRDVRPEIWAAHNKTSEERLARWNRLVGWRVQITAYVKYGKTRWETQLGAYVRIDAQPRVFIPTLVFYFSNKDEATAKAVELVLRGYADKLESEP